MLGTMAAILGAGIIGAGTQLYGAHQANKFNKKAQAALAAQQAKNEGYMQPYMAAGTNALKTYQDALGLNGADAQKAYYSSFETDPGWQAANDAALNATNDRYRLTGSSGGNVRAALYNQGQQNMLGAYNTRLAQIQGLVSGGQNAASTLVGSGTSLGTAGANLLSGAGQNIAQGISGAGNAVSGMFGNMANMNMFQQYLNTGMAGASGGNTGATAGMLSGYGVGSNPIAAAAIGANNAWRYLN